MVDLHIEKTNSTPGIDFDAESGLLRIRGESFPENVVKFYTPIIEWIKEYISLTEEEILFVFEIPYFNSSSSKILMTIFDLLEQEVKLGRKISVKWRCDQDNETAIECGEEFKEDITLLPFVIEVY